MASGQPDGNTAKVGDLAQPIAGLDSDGKWQAIAVDTTGGIALAVGATGIGKVEDEPHASGDVGVPVLGVVNRHQMTLHTASDDGDYVNLSLHRNGMIRNTSLYSSSLADTNQFAFGQYHYIGYDITAIPAEANFLYGGTFWERQRNNEAVTALASAARTATTNSADLVNYNGRGVLVAIDVTAVTGSASVTVTVQTKQTIGNVYRDVLTSAAITTTGQTWLRVYPGITPVANEAVSDLLGRTYRVVVTHGTADAITYSVQSVTML